MRLPRVKCSLRSMTAAIAVLGIFCWISERKLRFHRLAEYHFLRSETGDIGCIMVAMPNGKLTDLIELGTGMPTTWEGRDWHRSLFQKYESATSAPWLPVSADPPKPE